MYAFDVQKDAVERSRARLEEAGLLDRVRLIHDGHERVLSHVQEPVDAAVFNLGWLPGGDKRFTTRVDTTLQALKGCLELLKPGGLMTICAYPGHEEGELERPGHPGMGRRFGQRPVRRPDQGLFESAQ